MFAKKAGRTQAAICNKEEKYFSAIAKIIFFALTKRERRKKNKWINTRIVQSKKIAVRWNLQIKKKKKREFLPTFEMWK